MKIEIRPEISILMCNCAAVKRWRRSVAWFLSYEAKRIADTNVTFQKNAIIVKLEDMQLQQIMLGGVEGGVCLAMCRFVVGTECRFK